MFFGEFGDDIMISDLPRRPGPRLIGKPICFGAAVLLLTGTALTTVRAQSANTGATPAFSVVSDDAPSTGQTPALTVVPDSAAGASPSASQTGAPAIASLAPDVLPAIPPSDAANTTMPMPSVTPAPKTVNAATKPSPTPLPSGQPPEAGTASPLATAPSPTPENPAPAIPVPAAAATGARPALPPSQTVSVVPPSQNVAMPPALTPDQTVSNTPANPGKMTAAKGAPTIGGAAGSDLSPIGADSGSAANAIHPSRSAGPAGPDDYYDSSSRSPGSPLVAGQGPRKLNPSKEPGQKFVVAERVSMADSRDAQIAAGQRALAAGQYGAAAEIYDGLYKRYPKDENVLMGRAIAYQHDGDSRKAADMYDRMLDIDPQNVDAQVNILGIMGKQYPDAALHKLMALHDRHPADPLIVAQLGVIEGQQGNYEASIPFLQAACNLEPNNPQHLFNLAIVADKAGQAGRRHDLITRQALDTDASLTAMGGPFPRDKVPRSPRSALRQHCNQRPAARTGMVPARRAASLIVILAGACPGQFHIRPVLPRSARQLPWRGGRSACPSCHVTADGIPDLDPHLFLAGFARSLPSLRGAHWAGVIPLIEFSILAGCLLVYAYGMGIDLLAGVARHGGPAFSADACFSSIWSR